MKLKYTEAAEFHLFHKRGEEIQEKNRKKFDMRIEVKGERKTQQHRKRGSDSESEGTGSIAGKAKSFENTSEAAAIQQPNGDDTEDSAPNFVDAFDNIEGMCNMEPSIPAKQRQNFVRIGRND